MTSQGIGGVYAPANVCACAEALVHVLGDIAGQLKFDQCELTRPHALPFVLSACMSDAPCPQKELSVCQE